MLSSVMDILQTPEALFSLVTLKLGDVKCASVKSLLPKLQYRSLRYLVIKVQV